jgi:hypothetical protein
MKEGVEDLTKKQRQFKNFGVNLSYGFFEFCLEGRLYSAEYAHQALLRFQLLIIASQLTADSNRLRPYTEKVGGADFCTGSGHRTRTSRFRVGRSDHLNYARNCRPDRPSGCASN